MSYQDSYYSLALPTCEVLFKEMKSKFYGYGFPINSENDVKPILAQIQKQHPKARHVCYAYHYGISQPTYRTYDDGEPNNAAGQPIYGQILSKNLNYVLVIVVRYFGGVKLGVGGLVSAYKTTAQLVLENGVIIQKEIQKQFQIKVGFDNLSKVLQCIQQNQIEILSQQASADESQSSFFQLICISIKQSEALRVQSLFKAIHLVEIKDL